MYSLYANTTGTNNTAIGYYSLAGNTTGAQNTAQGMYSLYSNTTGTQNTAVGNRAGRYQSDDSTNPSGSNSVYIGYNTKASGSVDAETNQIVIGSEAVGIGSNTAVLGNDSITTTALKGNVGIGTTSPTQKLTVAGNISVSGTNITVANATNPYIYVNDTNGGAGIFQQEGNDTKIGSDSNTQLQLIQNNAAAVTISTDKYVGIGTTSPIRNLDLYNTGNSLLAIRAGTSNNAGILFYDGSSEMFDVQYKNSTDTFQLVSSADSAKGINIVRDTGYVGIGTTIPSSSLQVGGLDDGNNYDITLGWNAVPSQAVGTKRSAITFKTSLTGVNNEDIYKWDIAMLAAPATVTNEEYGSDLAFLRSTRNSTAVDATTMILTREGNVGIGTSVPNEKLTVSGSISASGDLYLDGNIYDVNNSTGSSGQVLSSTTAGVDWIDNAGSGVTGSWSNHDYITVTSGSGAINDSQYKIEIDQSSSISGSNQHIGRQSHDQMFYRGEGEQTLPTEGTYDLLSGGVGDNDAAAMFVDYLAYSGSIQKVGTITGTSGGALSETTASVGNTSDIGFGFTFASNTMKLQATTTAIDWQVSYHYRVLTNTEVNP